MSIADKVMDYCRSAKGKILNGAIIIATPFIIYKGANYVDSHLTGKIYDDLMHNKLTIQEYHERLESKDSKLRKIDYAGASIWFLAIGGLGCSYNRKK